MHLKASQAHSKKTGLVPRIGFDSAKDHASRNLAVRFQEYEEWDKSHRRDLGILIYSASQRKLCAGRARTLRRSLSVCAGRNREILRVPFTVSQPTGSAGSCNAQEKRAKKSADRKPVISGRLPAAFMMSSTFGVYVKIQLTIRTGRGSF